MKKIPELLSPVFDFTSLTAAINAGCNAVYFGIKELNMRITAKNFKLNEIKKVVDICHKNNIKAYLTLNTIIYDSELKKLKKIINEAKKAKIDAIICWDFSVINEARKKGIPIHISTQSSVSNSESARFYKKLGAERIVLARELSLEQIKKIKKEVKIDIECFIHGAMCVSVSGRCFTSQFLFGKSANRGDCIQPCRRSYLVKDEEGCELKLENNYVLSPKDLCTLAFIDKLIEAGIDSFKIEGRARSPEYVSVVTKCYRDAIDAYFKNKLINELKKELIKKLKTVYNRDFSSGFYMGKPINEFTGSESKATRKKTFIGIVKNYYKNIKVAEIKIQSHSIKLNDILMFQGPTTGVYEQKIDSMEINHKKVNSVEKGNEVGIKVKNIVRKNDRVFLIKKIFKH
ncbi:MAG: U32 family peptidase [Nanoarchaeota archaeon]|nr:U32 family peptidase [Nanoarchaeota archaeon]MBU0962674.1 U32 family peptidase [Nanoarchaeota archaeon]